MLDFGGSQPAVATTSNDSFLLRPFEALRSISDCNSQVFVAVNIGRARIHLVTRDSPDCSLDELL